MASENTRKWAIIPEPNSMTVGEGTVLLPYAGRVNESIAIGDGDFLLAHQLVADIRSATGTDWDIATGDMWSGFIRLRIADSWDFDSQDGGTAGAYTLTINTDGITITGCDFEGVRNGVQTLRQLIRQNGAVLPELQIADAPACQIRGYYLDATRGRVPTLAWLKQWADKLCLYKYNQLQLYIEHTFAFDGMSETWRGSSPLTPADTLEFDQYCANLGIELVPSVSTFGHQYVAMRTQELRELGEFPEDADRPFSFIERMRHHTLNVADDRAFAFSAQLVDSYLQLFRSKRFNICADETFDLGKGKSKQEAQRVGVATLYATYVGKLCEHLSKQGREPMFWGDIAIEMPEILETLPNNVTLLNWQYEPEATDEKIQLVAQAGAKQIVCPAVWGWNALLPRIDDAWNNIARIARYGLDCGAEGMLVTDWGDFGHVNDPRMAVPGMIFGAQYAWNPAGDTAEDDLLERISRVEYGDCSARFVALLRNASAQAVFTWRELVEYLELDDGTGNCNTDVAQTIPCLADRLVDHLSDCGNAMTVREARNRMMRNMATTIERIPQANRALQQCMVDIAPIAAHMEIRALLLPYASPWKGSCCSIEWDSRSPKHMTCVMRMTLAIGGLPIIVRWRASSNAGARPMRRNGTRQANRRNCIAFRKPCGKQPTSFAESANKSSNKSSRNQQNEKRQSNVNERNIMTEVIIVKNEREAGDIYGRSVADLIKTKPNAVLGLATGSSPLAAYQSLARIVHSEHIDVSQVRGFALDEYLGLPLDHPQSYHSTIHRTVVEPLGLNPDLVHVPGDVLDGAPLSDGERIAAAGPAYDKAIEEAGGIDVQILGIGTDGHVGFNEPGSSLASGTRVKTLVEQTRIDNARFFDDDIDKVPTHCITQGIGTILKARHLVLLAFGSGKAEAVAETVEGGVSAFCPASALQMHPHATIIVDEEAASRLRHKDYYRYAYAHKPAWQRI